MLKNLLSKRKLQEGFTIIEVMIVLAIAGLILVVVLIAIPQLQRNQRNENRRSVMARIVTEVNSFAGNNNGRIPGGVVDVNTDLTSVMERYLGCDPAGLPNVPVTCDVNINDPSDGEPFGMEAGTDAAGAPPSLVDETYGGAGAGHLGILLYQDGMICDGEALNDTDAEARNFVVYTVLEGGAIYCLDNR